MSAPTSPSHPQSGSPGSILVIDDNDNDRSLLCNYLRSKGYRLHVATNGQEGFELARDIEPDLVILDVQMPVCDGLACCRMLKSSPDTADIPVIFLSAAVMPLERVQGLKAGAVDYITKPFDFEEVQLRVGIHLPHPSAGKAAVSFAETKPLALETSAK